MEKILFVCHGNICRSPMAEFVMKELVLKAGLEEMFSIESAGTSREELGNPVYPPARKILARHGIDSAGKTARQIRPEDYRDFDYLIGMEAVNIKNMRKLWPLDPEGKIFCLLDRTDDPRDIADPWYSGDFQRTWDEVSEGCEALFRWLREEQGAKEH